MNAIRARKTAYAGVVMRSRLEADYASYLDRCGYEWEYEPIVFAGPKGQWLPDFRIETRDKSYSQYVELKPVSHLGFGPKEDRPAFIARIDELLSRMSMTWLTEPDALLGLIWWEYGRNIPIAMICAGRLTPWLCDGEMSLATVWPGMGVEVP